jgi:hypothetical protein
LKRSTKHDHEKNGRFGFTERKGGENTFEVEEFAHMTAPHTLEDAVQQRELSVGESRMC